MILCATGHRPNKLGNEYDLKGPYSKFIFDRATSYIRNKKAIKIISGMALGVDQIWAMAGIRLGVPVVAAIPFVGQEKVWPEASQRLYKKILDHSLVEIKTICPGGYSASKMHKRDEWMVDNSDAVFAVWNGTSGGTSYTVNYAQKANKEIFILNPEEWRLK